MIREPARPRLCKFPCAANLEASGERPPSSKAKSSGPQLLGLHFFTPVGWLLTTDIIIVHSLHYMQIASTGRMLEMGTDLRFYCFLFSVFAETFLLLVMLRIVNL